MLCQIIEKTETNTPIVIGENIDTLETYQLLLNNLGKDLTAIKDDKIQIIQIKK